MQVECLNVRPAQTARGLVDLPNSKDIVGYEDTKRRLLKKSERVLGRLFRNDAP